MKRSEMVNIIKNAMTEGYIKPDEILCIIEESGMLPPEYDHPILFISLREWEPENE